jgi:predicted DCC family thiol-disulfide oxidoreductase YuxK
MAADGGGVGGMKRGLARSARALANIDAPRAAHCVLERTRYAQVGRRRRQFSFGHVATVCVSDSTLRHSTMHASSVSPRTASGAFASPSRVLPRRFPPVSRVGSRARAFRPTAASSADVASALFTNDKRPIILFDGVCNLCNGGVNLALDLDPPGKLRFAALQSAAGQALLRRAGRDENDISSIVLVEENKAYTKSDAVLRIATYLENPALPAAAALGMFFPNFVRDLLYDLVADNRYKLLGIKDECRLSDTRFDDRFVADAPAGTTGTTGE